LPKTGKKSLAAIHAEFAQALTAAGLSFGPRHQSVSRALLSSLATKRFVIITGLSGSGKTQIAIKFGEWLCPSHWLIVPVRPDWTGPEALLGFEDALRRGSNGHNAWNVPETLSFILTAAQDPSHPYLLVLDEMNLAHVERYFADVLSGMESQSPCIPNLEQTPQGWFPRIGAPSKIPLPDNLFIAGTVNVDETTYMFSPKVLDRANTLEFRVESADLDSSSRRPSACTPATTEIVESFLSVSRNTTWQSHNPAKTIEKYQDHLRNIHGILSKGGFEFGHRVFYEAIRFAAIDSAFGATMESSLDLQVLQKLLPRLHGSRRQLESTLLELSRFCEDLRPEPAEKPTSPRPPETKTIQVALPLSFQKLQRMLVNLRNNQFTSFTD
jgi:5-methylcytosine-specific restriction protein B